MRIPDQSIIEKTLDNEATPEEAREVVHWFKTPEGQAWLAKRMDMDEKAIHMGQEEEWIDHPVPSAVMYQRIVRQLHRQRIRRLIAYAAAILIPVALFIGLFMRINSQVDLLADDGYDEVYVPNGERMQVLFQDGSKVHLNSGSRIRYPKKFGLYERKVYLEGEAWFEVAKNKNRPFVVDLSYMDIKVLGTSFNMKSYPSETQQVTLVQGKVEVRVGNYSRKLQPGEQLNYSSEGPEIRNVDVKAYTAWKDRRFVFNDDLLEEVIHKLGRWYDVEFFLRDAEVRKIRFTGNLPKYRNLDQVLNKLELTTHIRFVQNGRAIEVFTE